MDSRESTAAPAPTRWLSLLTFAGAACALAAAVLLARIAIDGGDEARPALAALGLGAAAVACLVAVSSRRRRRTEGRNEVFESIAALTDPALMRLEPDELVDELLGRTLTAIDPDVAGIVLFGDGDGSSRVEGISARDAKGPLRAVEVSPQTGLLSNAIRTGTFVLADDTTGTPVGVTVEGRTIRSFAACPLQVEGRVLGVAFLSHPRPRSFDLDDVRLLQRVADRLALALERRRLDAAEQEGREALAAGEARLRSVVEAAPLGILELNVAGALERWNPAVTELLDWPPYVEHAPKPALQGELGAVIADLVTSTRRGQRTEAREIRIERRGGPAVTLNLSGAPLLGADGRVAGVLVLLADVTEHRQLEQHIRQAQRLDALSRLAGGVAHDFNNLLTVVVGYSQFLLQQLPESSPIREDIEAISKAGHRASELTSQLLTIGRRQVVEPIVLDVQERVADLEPIIRRLVGADIELRVVTGKGAGNVRVDPHEFEQVVMNLCINARDAMPNGGRLVVESREIELDPAAAAAAAVPPGPYVLLTVADTGTGMPEEVREHCFDPFFTTKGRGKGTGLGLAAVYGVVQQCGGRLDVQSEIGRGTTFRLFFPLAADPVTKVAAKKASGRGRSTRKGRVLLVEDEAPVRKLAKAVLEDRGHTVVEMATAEDALALARRVQQPFDVLVSDIVMPGMHGDDLANEMVEIWPSLRVLLVSGYVERAAALDGSRVEFLAKPFALDELADRVAAMMPAPGRKRRASGSAAKPPKAPSSTSKAKAGTAKKASAAAPAKPPAARAKARPRPIPEPGPTKRS